MDRQLPRSSSDEIDLYIRTYYSLLRSSGDVRVRAFEESHLFSRSSLHVGAQDAVPDLAAFAYSAGRLPDCMPRIRRIVLGQSLQQFAAAGYHVDKWQVVRTRGRRRPLRYDCGTTLAAFIASASDIDDLVPIVTAYQIEWNKLLQRLLSARLTDITNDAAMIEPAVPKNRPVYFVSSNSHALANLMGGYARLNLDVIVDYLRSRDTENLAPHYDEAVAKGDTSLATNILYYALRSFLSHEPQRLEEVQKSEDDAGIRVMLSPGKIDVGCQVIELSSLGQANLDPRLHVPGIERIAQSRAVIVNIDYPLGMAAYHHLSAVALGVADLRGIFIMGKAATLNGRVGDVMISKAIHDEHSQNTYLFRNALTAADVAPFMKYGTVLDNQKAVTVRSAFLQNREYMDVFYREGYTVMEMEAGPYLSAAYEIAEPRRHPKDELVSLVEQNSFEFGVIHYASDTPYSRRQSLLSKSMSYFGMESTYGCAIAISRRIFASELARLGS
ncbi:MAG: hypothetical protein NT062_13925 [Proteobacteria bacterium]|nr:hypothetical protein [Pseudomonadota bacterium]